LESLSASGLPATLNFADRVDDILIALASGMSGPSLSF
jgi:hypothetical protein